jgi:hypothetical protein
VVVPGTLLYPTSVTPDGRQVAAVDEGDSYVVKVENGKSRVEPLLRTPAFEVWPEFSPDGRWLVFASDRERSGRFEVYVQPFRGPGDSRKVSIEGGDSPAWNPNGREIFFLSAPDPAGGRRMMAVAFSPGPPLTLGLPRELFSYDQKTLAMRCEPMRCYDVAPDGQRFYAVQYGQPAPVPLVTRINLFQNWFEELKAKVPVTR